MFLLVPAHPGCPGQIPQSRKTVVCVCVTGYYGQNWIHHWQWKHIDSTFQKKFPNQPSWCFYHCSFLGFRRITYDRLPAFWQDNYCPYSAELVIKQKCRGKVLLGSIASWQCTTAQVNVCSTSCPVTVYLSNWTILPTVQTWLTVIISCLEILRVIFMELSNMMNHHC